MTSPKIDEEAFDKACEHIGLKDGVVELVDSGNLRSFLAAYLSRRAEQGFREMPRAPTMEMIVVGVAERHGQPVPEAWSLATQNIWTAMFDQHAKDSSND